VALTAPVVVAVGEVLWDMLPSGARLGGAPANFAYHAAQLGAQTFVVSRVGDDALGRRVLQAWKRAGIDGSYLQVDPSHATGKVIVELRGGTIPHYTIARESAWDYIEWCPELGEIAERADIVCYGTLAQRSPVSRSTIQRFAAAAEKAALRVLDANLRHRFYSAELLEQSLSRANVLKVNDQELGVAARLLSAPASLRGATGRRAIAEHLLERYRLAAIVVTRGARGSELFTGTDVITTPAPETSVVDTVGAGDAFTAALALGYWQRRDWQQAAEWANRCGAYVASKAGATPRLPKALRTFMEVD
jgi:fructokinase